MTNSMLVGSGARSDPNCWGNLSNTFQALCRFDTCPFHFETARKSSLIFYSTCHHAPHESSHGTTGTSIQGLPRHASRPLPVAVCGVPPPPAAARPSCSTPHRTGALRHNGHGYVSTPARTYGVQPGHGRTSRSGGSPVSHAPHRTVPLSAWDSRGRNTVSSVSLAQLSPPRGIKKAPAGEAPTKAACLYAVFDDNSVPRPKWKIVRDFGHQLFPYSSVTSFCRARFFFLYADVRSMWKRSQMS